MILKNGKEGISLIVLSVAALVIITLTTVITYSLVNNHNKAKKIEFAQEINMLQISVDSYYGLNKMYPSKNSVTISNISDEAKSQQFIGETQYTFSVIDYEKIGITSLKYGNSKNGTNDIYVVSEETGKVYYAAGLVIDNKIYFTINSELSNLLNGESKQEINVGDQIIFSEEMLNATIKKVTVKIPKSYTNITVKAENSPLTEYIDDSNYRIYSKESSDEYTLTVTYTYNSQNKTSRYLVKGKIEEPSIEVPKNEQTIDGVKYTATIPAGFYYVGGTISTGLIISDNAEDENKGDSYEVASSLKGNQFVWIPTTYIYKKINDNSPEVYTGITSDIPSMSISNFKTDWKRGTSYKVSRTSALSANFT